MKGKKANVTLYIVFIIFAILIVVIAGVFAPMGVLFNSEMYQAGEDILRRANDSIQGIGDSTVRARVTATLDSAFIASENNIDVNAGIFQYSWIFIIVLTALVIFIYTRSLSERRIGGGLV